MNKYILLELICCIISLISLSLSQKELAVIFALLTFLFLDIYWGEFLAKEKGI